MAYYDNTCEMDISRLIHANRQSGASIVVPANSLQLEWSGRYISVYFFIYVVRNFIVIVKKSMSKFLRIYVFSVALKMENCFWNTVCLSDCMYVRLSSP
jgi:hypothetical protein